MESYCANCYKLGATFTCEKCKARAYCDLECQTHDWEESEHKRFCGRSGELGVDFEIKDSQDKGGLGVFAMRDFKTAEIVMVEKPVYYAYDPANLAAPIRQAISQLVPTGGSFEEKLQKNAIGCNESSSLQCLLITMSRVNHECLGNSNHYFYEKWGIMVLQATRGISAGDEITFPYVQLTSSGDVLEKWGFDCHCKACVDDDTRTRIISLGQLDTEIQTWASIGAIDQAFTAAQKLLKVYDRLGYSPQFYHRTYYDMYNLMKHMEVPQCRIAEVAVKVNHYAELWYESDSDQVQRSRQLPGLPPKANVDGATAKKKKKHKHKHKKKR